MSDLMLPAEQAYLFSNIDDTILQVLAVISSTWKKAPLVILKAGQRLTGEVYTELLHMKNFPWTRRNFSNKWVWEQRPAATQSRGCKTFLTF